MYIYSYTMMIYDIKHSIYEEQLRISRVELRESVSPRHLVSVCALVPVWPSGPHAQGCFGRWACLQLAKDKTGNQYNNNTTYNPFNSSALSRSATTAVSSSVVVCSLGHLRWWDWSSNQKLWLGLARLSSEARPVLFNPSYPFSSLLTRKNCAHENVV